MPNDNSGLPRGAATDRSECRCPDCLSYEGIEEMPEATQLYDDPVDEILHASKCANDACRTSKIDPKSLRKQIDKDAIEESEPLIDFDEISIRSYISKPSNLAKSVSWKVAGVVLLFVLAATFGTLGGLGGGGGGIAEAGDSYQGLETESGTSPDAVYEASNWTVYESGNSYITSGVIIGSIVYLTSEGQVTDSPYSFENLTAAKEAITLWQARNDQLPSKYPQPELAESVIEESNWQVFSYNGSYLVAGKIDGQAVFLQPNGNYVSEPYFFENKGPSEQAILYWVSLTQTNDLPTVKSISASQLQGVLSDWDSNEDKFNTWNDTDLGNWGIYTDGSSYLAVTSINGTIVYLQPDGSTSTSKATFDTQADLIDSLNTWRYNNPDVTTEPLAETPDLSSEWDPIDYQDTIPDDSTSDSPTTIDDDSISSPSGSTSTTTSDSATVAGTVKDTNDQPVEDAKVTLHSNPQTTTTDSNGEFSFSNVLEGDHTIHVSPPDGTDLAAPRNTSIHVNADGEVTPKNDPANVLYFENNDGTISQNQLTFLTQEKHPIQISGKGSDVHSTIEVANPSNINDLEVSFSPEYTATRKTATLSGSDTTDKLKLNGTTPPENQSIFLNGVVAGKTIEVTDTYTGDSKHDIPIKGNIRATNPSVIIHGSTIAETTKTESNDTGSYNVNGYLNNFTANLTPVYTATEASTTLSGHSTSQTLNINGKVKPKKQYIDLNGEIVNTPRDVSGSLSGSNSNTVGLDGNMNTQDTTVDITPKNTETTLVSGYNDLYLYLDHYSYASDTDSDVVATLPEDGTYDMSFTASFRQRAGWSESSHVYWDLKVRYPNGTTEDLRTYSNRVGTYGSSPPDQTHSYKGTFPAGTDVIMWGKVYLNSGGRGEIDVYEGYIKTSDPVEDVVISHDGTTIQSYNSLGKGDSKTVDLGSLPTDSPVDISVNKGDIDYSVSYTARALPEQGTISAGGQTYTWNNDFEGSGTLPNPNDNPARTNISSLTTGDNSISLSTGEIDGIQTEATAEFVYDDQTDQTRDPKITVTQPDDTTNSKTIENGVLKSSSEISVPGNWFDPDGQNTIKIESNGPSPNSEIKYTPLNSPSNLSASINGNEVWTHTDRFSEKENIEINLSQSHFENDSITFEINPRDDSSTKLSKGDAQINYTLNYTAQTTPTTTLFQVGTETYDYPEDFPRTGKLSYPPYGEPAQINISALTTGEQPVSISTEPVDGIETKAEATIVYDGETKQTHQPSIVVEKPDGTINEKPIPDSALQDGQLVSAHNMTIPSNWVGTGTNKITIRTTDDSVVSATITTKGLEYQNKSLDYGS